MIIKPPEMMAAISKPLLEEKNISSLEINRMVRAIKMKVSKKALQ